MPRAQHPPSLARSCRLIGNVVSPNPLLPGDYAPWFHAPALAVNPSFAFDSTAGRHVLMLFFGSAGHAPCAKALQLIEEHRAFFDDARACFFGVTIDPAEAG